MNAPQPNPEQVTAKFKMGTELLKSLRETDPQKALAMYQGTFSLADMEGKKLIVAACREWAKSIDGIDSVTAMAVRKWLVGSKVGSKIIPGAAYQAMDPLPEQPQPLKSLATVKEMMALLNG